jgi:2-dehydropantoate 2-reductase
LRIESAHDPVFLPDVNATDDPATIGEADFVLFCVKLWDSEAAALSLKPVMPRSTIISLQNGVQKDDLLRSIFGEAAVMGGVAYVATTIGRPGVIAQTGAMQRLIFGEFDGSPSPRAEALLAACQAAGINAEVSDDIRRAIWEKFVFLVGLSGATTAIRTPLGPILNNPSTRDFFLDLMREAVAVGRSLGVALPEGYAEARLAFAEKLPYDMTSSMHHDLERGRPLEIRWLSGGVMELGKRAGVPTPMNRAVHDVLILHAEGRPDAESLTAKGETR